MIVGSPAIDAGNPSRRSAGDQRIEMGGDRIYDTDLHEFIDSSCNVINAEEDQIAVIR